MKLKTEDIEKAAKLHLEGIEDDVEQLHLDVNYPNDEMYDIHEFITDAFKTGATWGVWMATKNLWHDVSEKPSLKHGESVSLLYQYQNEGDEEIIDSTFTYSWFEDWNVYAALYGIRRWCRIADILPQQD